jgi:hypothetical protein
VLAVTPLPPVYEEPDVPAYVAMGSLTTSGAFMNGIIYLVGLAVVIIAILSFVGLR